MTPQIGDPVVARYQGRKLKINGLVTQGAKAPVLTAAGTLNVVLDAEGAVKQLVVESDGSATFISRADLVSLELDLEDPVTCEFCEGHLERDDADKVFVAGSGSDDFAWAHSECVR